MHFIVLDYYKMLGSKVPSISQVLGIRDISKNVIK